MKRNRGRQVHAGHATLYDRDRERERERKRKRDRQRKRERSKHAAHATLSFYVAHISCLNIS